MIKKVVISLFFFLLFLFFVGVGLLGWFQGQAWPVLGKVVTVPVLEKPAPQVFSEMKQNMSGLQTASYDLEINVRPVQQQTLKNIKINALFNGQIGQFLLGQLHVGIAIDVNDLDYLAAAEFRLTDSKSYVQISEIPALSFITMSAIKDRWYVFKPGDIADPNGGQWRTVGRAVGSTALITSYERKPDEMIDGREAYRFDVRLDHQAFSHVIDSLADSSWPGQTRDIISTYLSDQQVAGATLWIGKKDLLLYRAELQSAGRESDLDVRLAVNDFNKEIAIEQPGDTEPISVFPKNLFSETNFLDWPLFGYQFGLNLSDMTADADKDGLYEIWETAFSTNPQNSDTDGDGFADGSEVRSGYRPNGQGKFMSDW
ncbi:MAG: hypothetical protein WCT27_03335 [Patescibacteria group bacterium]